MLTVLPVAFAMAMALAHALEYPGKMRPSINCRTTNTGDTD